MGEMPNVECRMPSEMLDAAMPEMP